MGRDNQFPNLPYRSAQELLSRLLSSLAMRDWEDEPNPDEATAERKALMDEITKRSDAAPLVLPLLKHKDWLVREHSINMLGRLRAIDAVADLTTLLHADDPNKPQYHVIAALEHIGTTEALAIAHKWRQDNNFTKRDELNSKIGDYHTYGTTDQAFEARLHEVAARRGLALKELIIGWTLKSPDLVMPEKLPPELQAFFDEMKQTAFTEEDLLYLEG